MPDSSALVFSALGYAGARGGLFEVGIGVRVSIVSTANERHAVMQELQVSATHRLW